MALTADELIRELNLQPHPEGGWFVETYRDNRGGERGHSTAIYFLLKAGESSHWHRVMDAAEVWHHYAGAPLELGMWSGEGDVTWQSLGSDLAAGERPQAVVPAGWWQAAVTTGEWTLVGCTVAPGFDFSAFELAEPGWEPPV